MDVPVGLSIHEQVIQVTQLQLCVHGMSQRDKMDSGIEEMRLCVHARFHLSRYNLVGETVTKARVSGTDSGDRVCVRVRQSGWDVLFVLGISMGCYICPWGVTDTVFHGTVGWDE